MALKENFEVNFVEVIVDYGMKNYSGVTERKARMQWLYMNIFINLFYQKIYHQSLLLCF